MQGIRKRIDLCWEFLITDISDGDLQMAFNRI